MTKKVLGLDIGSKYIKIAMAKKGKKHTVLKTMYAATPTDSVVNGEIKNVDTVTARIRSKLFEEKFKPTELYVSINSNNVVAREIKLPILNDKEIDPAIEFELMQSFPGIIQSHTISSRIYSEPGMPVEGITVFCPNKILSDYVEVAKGLLVPLKGIDVNANSLAKAAYHYLPEEKKNETMLMIDVGYAMSQVNLISEGRLIISRQIQTGVEKFDNLVANRIGITLDQAERARQNNKYDIYNLDKEDIEGFIKIAFSAVVEQLRSIMDYYRYHKSDDSKISSILLFAGRGLDTSLTQYFGETLNLPVNTLDFSIKDSVDPAADAMAIAAVGATMDPQGGKKDINLLPKLKEIRAAGIRRIKLTRALAIILIMGAVGLATYTFLEFLIRGISSRIVFTQDEIIRYSPINITKDNLQISKDKLTNAEKALKAHSDDTLENTELFDTINKAMPDNVFAKSYSVSNEGVISMSGISHNRINLVDFIYNLQQSDKIEGVALASVSVRADADDNPIDYSFTLEIKISKAGA